MKILFITPNLPSDLNRVRCLNIIKSLYNEHELHLISFTNKKNPDTTEIEKYFKSIKTIYLPTYRSYLSCLLGIFSNKPLRVAYFKSKKMEKAIEDKLKENFDLVYVKRMRMGHYLLNFNVKKIIDLTDCMTLLYKRSLSYVKLKEKIINYFEYKRLKKYEPWISSKFDKALICSFIDKNYLVKISNKELDIKIIPNVVDHEYYKRKEIQEEKNSILFSGCFNAFVNQDAVFYFHKNIWPKIIKKNKSIKFYIVGPNPPHQIRKLNNQQNIIVTGKVEDIRDYISKCSIVIVPIRIGAGTRNKILQALSIGKPVISTSIGAEGLNRLDENNIIITDNSHVFASQIIRVIKNKRLREKLSKKNNEIIKKYYSVISLKKYFNNLFEDLNLL